MADQATSSITVNADKAAVMAVIADFDAYPEWASMIRSVTVDETGSDGRGNRVTFVLDAIRDTQPAVELFGHVHNPLVRRVRIGKTECVNVGHFRGRGTPYVLEW